MQNIWLTIVLAATAGYLQQTESVIELEEPSKIENLPHRTTIPTLKPVRTSVTTSNPTRTTSVESVTTSSRTKPVTRAPEIIQFPDDYGVLHDVNLSAEPDHKLLSDIGKYPAKNTLYLFTRSNQNKPQVLIMNNENSILESHYRKGGTTYVVVHGWLGGSKSEINNRVKNAVLDAYDANVIVVDWKRLSHADYLTAVLGVPAIGRGLGEFLNFLSSTTGDCVENFYLIGFSLGAHVVGNAGRTLSGKVGRITALDPAGPLWKYNPDSIAEQDALYVEAIHTDGKEFGLLSRVGHTDFYVNGGEFQLGCITNVCSHERSWKLFAVSIASDNFVGYECKNELDALIDRCHGKPFVMGNGDVKKRGSGLYRVNTKSRFPYY